MNHSLCNELLGALVGLSHVISQNPKSENTDRVFLLSLSKCRDAEDAAKEDLEKYLRLVLNEKNLLSPGCQTCACPCGNTANYDMEKLQVLPKELRLLKEEMLEKAIRAASELNKKDISQNAYAQRVLSIEKALFFLSEDVSADALLEMITELEP